MTSDFLGQATSDFTKQAYVLKYLIMVGRQVDKKNPKKHMTSYVNAPMPEYMLKVKYI